MFKNEVIEMSKFNTTGKQKRVKNHEGAPSFNTSNEMELYNLVSTFILEERFYESSNEQLKRLVKLISKTNSDFVNKLAVYEREDMYLRSVPLVLLVENARKGLSANLGSVVTRTIKRADEIAELLAYYQISNQRVGAKKLNRLSKQIQKGAANAFNKFDEYQFAKYNRKGAVTLKDALFLTHPKARDENQQALFNRIASDSLEVPYTWEVELSKKGNTKKVWQELIASGRLGYMALLRNLRNILNAGLDENYISKVADVLSDKEKVRRSRQLPLRFYAAYREVSVLENSSMIIDALEKAIRFSMDSVEFFKNSRVLIASDVSGSMMSPLSKKSSLQYYDIGLLFSMLLRNRKGDRITTGIFGDIWKVKNMPKENILANVDYLKGIEGEVGYSTNGYKVLEWALKKSNYGYDRILFFTDCQLYDSYGKEEIRKYWKLYKRQFPESKIYFFNLAGYATTPVKVNESDVYLLSGWSDKVFDMLTALENGSSVIETIKKIEL
jgi:60 kDa SS-A/Ro ribonucleoprotein